MTTTEAAATITAEQAERLQRRIEKARGTLHRLLADIRKAEAIERVGRGPGRMVQIDDLISELTEIRNRYGNTCVYFHQMCWGAVALNRQDADEKLQAEREATEGEKPTST